MPEQKRRFAMAVSEMRSPDANEVVGWSYRWDDGTESRVLVEDLPPGWTGRRRVSTETPGNPKRTSRSMTDER